MAQTLPQGLRKVLATYLTNHPTPATKTALATLLPGGVHFGVASSQNATGTAAIASPYCVLSFISVPNVISPNDCQRVYIRPIVRVIIHGRGRAGTIDDLCDQAARLVDVTLEELRATAPDIANTAGGIEQVEVRGLSQQTPYDTIEDDGNGYLSIRKGGDYQAYCYYLPS